MARMQPERASRGGIRLDKPSGDAALAAAGRELAETIKRELAELGQPGTLEECMSQLRGRAWSS